MAKRSFLVNPEDKVANGDDPYPGCCEYVGIIGRCHYPGSLSSGGKFMCRDHFFGKADGEKVLQKSRFDVPSPDYSLAARRTSSNFRHMRGMLEHQASKDGKAPPKYADVITKLARMQH